MCATEVGQADRPDIYVQRLIEQSYRCKDIGICGNINRGGVANVMGH